MAIENNDLFVLQKGGGGELRKATVAALLADAVTPILPVIPDIPEKISDLDDVSDTVPADGQVLKWDGTEWSPADDEVRDLDNYLQKPGEEGDFLISEAADGTISYTTNYLKKPGLEGDFVISEAADGTITYSDSVDGGTY